MAVSVYVKGKPLHKGDYVSHYAVKGMMKVEEYGSIYDNNKNYIPTLFLLRYKDYMYLYSNEENWKGEYDDYMSERGIAQVTNWTDSNTMIDS